MDKRVWCNKCNKMFIRKNLNDLEFEEYLKEGCFVCSSCINEEMEKDILK